MQSATSHTWAIYDGALNRPLYEIDATGAITENQYGLSSKPIHTIQYAIRIPSDKLSTLPVELSKGIINEFIKSDPNDRHQRDGMIAVTGILQG